MSKHTQMDDSINNKENQVNKTPSLKRKAAKRSKMTISSSATDTNFQQSSLVLRQQQQQQQFIQKWESLENRLNQAEAFFREKLDNYHLDMLDTCDDALRFLQSKHLTKSSRHEKILYKKVKTFKSEQDIVLEKFWKKYSQHSLKNGKTLYYRCRLDEACTMKSQMVYNKFTEEIEFYEAQGQHKHLCEMIQMLKDSLVPDGLDCLHPIVETCESYSSSFNHQKDVAFFYDDAQNDFFDGSTLENLDCWSLDQYQCQYQYHEQQDQMEIFTPIRSHEQTTVNSNFSSPYKFHDDFNEHSSPMDQTDGYLTDQVTFQFSDSLNSEGSYFTCNDLLDASLLESLDSISNNNNNNNDNNNSFNNTQQIDLGQNSSFSMCEEIPNIEEFSHPNIFSNIQHAFDYTDSCLSANMLETQFSPSNLNGSSSSSSRSSSNCSSSLLNENNSFSYGGNSFAGYVNCESEYLNQSTYSPDNSSFDLLKCETLLEFLTTLGPITYETDEECQQL
jgi:hypothetical protein